MSSRKKIFSQSDIDLSPVVKNIEEFTVQEAVEQIVKIYNNFIFSRNEILEDVKKIQMLSDARKNKKLINTLHNVFETLDAHDENIELLYFKKGYEIINKIRGLLGLEITDYKVLFFDEIDPSNPKAYVWEGEIENIMRTRGSKKSGLAHSNDFFQSELEKLEQNTKLENIGFAFQSYIQILNKKHKENTGKNKVNYGYAWEAFGSLEPPPPPLDESDEGRHDIYYNYYANAHKNNTAWTKGGDIGNTQYKLIRRYSTSTGKISVSSASVTSENTIETILQSLTTLLTDTTKSKADIALELTDSFTKININKKIEQSIVDELNNIINNNLDFI